MMNAQLDMEIWRKTHDINAFGLRKGGTGEEFYGISKGEVQLVLPSARRLFPEIEADQEQPTLADLMLAYAKLMFEDKPEGKKYQDFVKRFGEDATDDLMSIVRAQKAFDDLLA